MRTDVFYEGWWTEKDSPPNFHSRAFENAEERLAASLLPPYVRQWMVENLLVKYQVFERGVEFIKEAHRPLKGGFHTTGAIVALYGQSRAGKTSICEYYAAQHPPYTDEEGEVFPVILMTATLRITGPEFAGQLNTLTAARAARLSGGITNYVTTSLYQIPRVRNELLMIDEAHYLFFQQTKDGAAKMFKAIKTIADFKQCSIMLVGDEILDEYVQENTPFENRYHSTPLSPLTASENDQVRFKGLLRSIDRRLPFANLSHLDQWSEDLFIYSHGKVGRVMKLVIPAAIRAMNTGASCILVEHLRYAVSTRLTKGNTRDFFGVLTHAS